MRGALFLGIIVFFLGCRESQLVRGAYKSLAKIGINRLVQDDYVMAVTYKTKGWGHYFIHVSLEVKNIDLLRKSPPGEWITLTVDFSDGHKKFDVNFSKLIDSPTLGVGSEKVFIVPFECGSYQEFDVEITIPKLSEKFLLYYTEMSIWMEGATLIYTF